MSKEEFRKVEILKNNEWQEIEFAKLELSSVIKMFDPDGAPVVMKEDDSTIWEVTKAPYKNADDVLTIEVESINGNHKWRK